MFMVFTFNTTDTINEITSAWRLSSEHSIVAFLNYKEGLYNIQHSKNLSPLYMNLY